MHDALRSFYRPEVSCDDDLGYSRSPSKPGRFDAYLRACERAAWICEAITVTPDFAPLPVNDFRLAHEDAYVDSFFSGDPPPYGFGSGLRWTPAFAESVRYTTGSLVAAVLGAIESPATIALSPTSGFHHAQPDDGSGFCTFSGQVIAGLKAYRAHGARGAWIDLDGHFGNSIPDTAAVLPEVGEALPLNLNPRGQGQAYLADLRVGLEAVQRALLRGQVHYVCFAHGADSHAWDQLGFQLSTAEWLEASRMVYGMIAETSARLGRPVPLALSLFGGYRDDDPASVMELHLGDLAIALSTLVGVPGRFDPDVKPPRRTR